MSCRRRLGHTSVAETVFCVVARVLARMCCAGAGGERGSVGARTIEAIWADNPTWRPSQ